MYGLIQLYSPLCISFFYIYRWNDGATFQGNWSAFKMNGQGKFTWSNGDVYEGSYVNDTVEGNNVIIELLILNSTLKRLMYKSRVFYYQCRRLYKGNIFMMIIIFISISFIFILSYK